MKYTRCRIYNIKTNSFIIEDSLLGESDILRYSIDLTYIIDTHLFGYVWDHSIIEILHPIYGDYKSQIWTYKNEYLVNDHPILGNDFIKLEIKHIIAVAGSTLTDKFKYNQFN